MHIPFHMQPVKKREARRKEVTMEAIQKDLQNAILSDAVLGLLVAGFVSVMTPVFMLLPRLENIAVCAGILGSIASIVLSSMTLSKAKQCAEEAGKLTGKAKTGRILAVIGLLLGLATLALCIIALIVMGGVALAFAIVLPGQV